jgi:hypothetical protein
MRTYKIIFEFYIKKIMRILIKDQEEYIKFLIIIIMNYNNRSNIF